MGFSLLLAFFVFFDQQIVSPFFQLVVGLNVLGLAAAGLFLNYVRGAVGLGGHYWAAFVPAVLYTLAAIALPGGFAAFWLIDGLVCIHILITMAAITKKVKAK